jgi:16S rRNA (cytosine967-C5)-methyltransferase
MPVSPARAAAFDILLRVEQQDAYASELLHSDRLDKLSPADRGLTTEIVMGVLRWRSRLDRALAEQSARPLEKLDPQVVTALRIAAYQLLYLSRVPARAAINESVELVKRARKASAAPFANAVLRKLTDRKLTDVEPKTAEMELAAATATQLAATFAHPEWLVERWVEHLGIANAEAICRHDQRIPTTSIRIDNEAVEAELRLEGIELAPGTLLTSARIVNSGDVTQTKAYREGRVFVQDEASQLVAALVGEGSRLLDCCAAPGSKTAAIAARNPAAEIIAVELHPHRAELLRRRVRATNVRIITTDALQLSLEGGFDRVLADVPCSGTGTLGRNPEIKWRLKPDDLNDLHAKQGAILRAALQQLAPGGRAVYSTCSLEPEENRAVVEEVLQSNSKFTLLDCRAELEALQSSGELATPALDSLLDGKYLRTIPGVHPYDGFFAALINRQS